jgi:hypothetical protein
MHGISTVEAEAQNCPRSSSNEVIRLHEPKEPSGTTNTADQCRHSTQPLDPPSVSRFIGDLNPEALVAEHDPGSGSRDRHDVGVWVGESGRRSNNNNKNNSKNQHDPQSESAEASSLEREAVKDAKDQPPPSIVMSEGVQESLVNIYFDRVNQLLPVVHEATFRNNGPRTSQHVIHAMCMVASQDASAENHLRFLESHSILGPRVFGSKIYAWLVQCIQDRRIRDKLSLIQTQVLMSLYSEGPDGAEEASMNLAQAIHHAQTFGLHLGRSSSGTTADGGSQKIRLFWAMWCLSKLNAALNGRPQLISDGDIGLKLDEVYEHCEPATRILLSISRLLSRVIEIYQPTAALDIMGIEEGFVSFESILDECHAWDIEPKIMSKCA